MNWTACTPPELRDTIASGLHLAAGDAFDYALGWYSADQGYDPQLFGSAITKSARHHATGAFDGTEGLEVVAAGHQWQLRWTHEGILYSLRIYKARPGSMSVIDLEFRSEAKLQVPRGNAAQYALECEGMEPIEIRERHLMAVLFGDPQRGLERIVVGSPIAAEDDGDKVKITWEWDSRLERPDEPRLRVVAPIEDDPARAAEKYGLRLKQDRRPSPEQ